MRPILLLLLSAGLFMYGRKVLRTPDWLEEKYPSWTHKIRRFGGGSFLILMSVLTLINAIKELTN
jgi:hypothetical protein